MKLTKERLLDCVSAGYRLRLLQGYESWGMDRHVQELGMKIYKLELPGGEVILATVTAGETARGPRAEIIPIVRYKLGSRYRRYSDEQIGILGADKLLREAAEAAAGLKRKEMQEATRRYKRR